MRDSAPMGDLVPPGICEPGGSGIFLPLFPTAELEWPTGLRATLYLVGLLWTFLGVAIVADVFMAAIEVITSREKAVKLPDGSTVKVKIWNATVANLTLMALGSSAPEILMSVIEITLSETPYYAGELGPGTIVGSAAFNMLVIIAVCMVAIPPPGGRKIDDLAVFGVTATFSIFAYLWLLVILSVSSPNVVTVTEALLTFIFFPVLVWISYLADIKFFSERKIVPSHIVRLGGVITKSGISMEMMNLLNVFSEKQKRKVTPDEALAVFNHMAAQGQKPTRAQLRINAMRSITGGKRIIPSEQERKEVAELNEMLRNFKTEGQAEEESRLAKVQFSATQYHCIESDGYTTVTVLREPAFGTFSVDFHTEAGTASPGTDYTEVQGTLTFEDGQTTQDIQIPIVDDDEVEDDEDFYVILSNPSPNGIFMEGGHRTKVTIIDDDEPGKLGFDPKDLKVNVTESCGTALLWVTRSQGSVGTVKCSYRTVPISAVPGLDYEAASGEVIFAPGEVRKPIAVSITNGNAYDEKNQQFILELYDVEGPPGGKSGLTDTPSCTITITADEQTKDIFDGVAKLMSKDPTQYSVSTNSWKEQFSEALTVEGVDGKVPGTGAYIMHFISLPWKVVFATIPPTHYMNGKVAFFVALAYIGVVTAIIGDLATGFGCIVGMSNVVTAITLVAMGTSLPDTFASKSACLADDNADAAIGNVTGSNSVNVFLGIGLPWSIAAFYWASQSASSDAIIEWHQRYGGPQGPGSDPDLPNIGEEYPNGAFIVPAGALGFNVAVFTACALLCITALMARRVKVGMELGGPKNPAIFTAVFLVGLWFMYLGLSIGYEA